LAGALQNRNLLKSIGEFEEYQPVEARPIREIRSLFDCLGSYGYHLGGGDSPRGREPEGLSQIFGIPANKVLRTEKVGSGGYTNLVRQPLKTGFPQLDAYGEARKEISFTAFDTFYRRVKMERKKRLEKLTAEAPDVVDGIDEADIAARDAVRCLEHAMITVAGEKSVYKSIVAPALHQTVDADDEDAGNQPMSPYLAKACAAAYSYVVAAIVDRTLDIIETVFLKEGGIGQTSGTKGADAALTVRVAAAAAAAGLRMLDGVRMLGPSLAKLCEMPVADGKTHAHSSLSATLCIAIHRTTVKNAARTLENLAKAIQEDPLKGPFHRPKDASVSSVSRDVVHAIRLISPYVSAYKSVSKRRALPWDPNMGEDAGELDSFVRHLVMRLLNSLKGKAINYTKDGRSDGQAKSNLFLMNNAFFLLDELGPNSIMGMPHHDAEHYRIDGTWFVDKINKIMDSEKAKYLCTWEQLNTHLTAVASGDLEYQKNDSNVLSHESGRLIKQRFSGFNEDFETTYGLHLKLCIIDQRLRIQLQHDVSAVFLPRYRRFYEKYNKIKFSKKHQSEYTKYSPDKIEDMLLDLYVDPIDPSQLG
jgi:exocyst complex component 7